MSLEPEMTPSGGPVSLPIVEVQEPEPEVAPDPRVPMAQAGEVQFETKRVPIPTHTPPPFAPAIEEMPADARHPIPPALLDPHGILHAPGVFPGANGVPFRGPTPNLKESDANQPTIGAQSVVDILDLGDPKDLKRYTEIWQVLTNGLAVLSEELKEYDKDTKSWRVFLRWGYQFSYLPKNKHSR